jgi:hypothetical protein
MGSDGNGSSRISVSEDKLRAVLAEFKLELFQDLRSYATQVAVDSLGTAMHAAVEGLGLRVGAVEKQMAQMQGGEDKGRQVSATVLAWAAILVAVLSALATLIWLNH